jgi:benzoate/toluate 1,2-dioxygenase reductase subunit
MDRDVSQTPAADLLAAPVTGRKWLVPDHAFEIRFERPAGFDFVPGQKIKLVSGEIQRNYSLISVSKDPELAICARYIPEGKLTPILARARIGQVFNMTPAFGFFVYQTSSRPAVFVATGTGIAPFASFVRSGIRGFRLLHGVRHPGELYYHDLLAPAADVYIACLSGTRKPKGHSTQVFQGRVTSYLEQELTLGDYDFYLCGSSRMVHDAMGIIDDRFPTARVFTETFY